MILRALRCLFAVLVFAALSVAAHANGVPVIYAPLVPASVAPGGAAFTLAVNGTGFVSGAVVNWNGSPRPTAFVSSSQVTASISAADIASAGTALVTVTNPSPGGGGSNTQFLQITNPVSSTAFSNSDVSGPRNGLANVASADFNGDGKLDLVTAIGSNIFVLLGNGDGTFGSPIATGGPNSNILQVFVADLNGDGKPDLVLATGIGTFTALGKGDGTFTLTGSSLADAEYAYVIADFNGDGNLDLAYTTFSTIQLQLGNGDGSFRPGPTTPLNQNYPGTYALAAGDFNQDGKLDLLVSSQSSGCIAGSRVLLDYPGNGDGSFGAPSQLPGTSTCGTNGVPNAVVADFNGDGKLDVAYFTQTGTFGFSGFLTIDLGNGDGTFQAPYQPLQQPNSVTGPLTIGDFNGDGKLDLVAGNQLFYGNGDGTLTAVGTTSNSLDAVLAGDFNGDGRLDLISVSGSTPDIRILLQIPTSPDFGGSVSPGSQTVVPGGTTSYTVTVSPLNGFTGDVTLSVSGLPSGVTGGFSPNPVTGGSGTSTLTLNAASSTALGNYTFTITGNSGSLAHSITANLTVNSSLGDFTGSVQPNPQNILAGGSATYTITISPTGGYTGDVNLSVTGLPPGSTSNLSPTTIHAASGTATLTIFTASSTPQNVYPITITATSGPLTHKASAYLGVAVTSRTWSGSITPTSQTLSVGGSTTFTVNTVRSSGTQVIDVQVSVSGLPPGATINQNPFTIFDPATSGTITISAPPGTQPGTYTLLFTGTGGGIMHQSTATLTVN